jgi:hypothetical protein
MKSKIFLSVLIAASLPVISAFALDGARYNVMAERMFEGIVASPGHVVDGMVFFPLRTEDRLIEVELGPKNFVGKSGFNLKVGEMVSVIGALADMGGQEVVLAREVRTMRAVLIVRDRNGYPMWDSTRPVEMDPEFSESGMCEMIMP